MHPLAERTARRLSNALLAACLALLLAAPAWAADAQTPEQMSRRLLDTPLPGRDPLDLAVRFRGISPDTPLVAGSDSTPHCLGDHESFWLVDQRLARMTQAQATLRLISGGQTDQGCALDPAAQAKHDQESGCNPCFKGLWYVQDSLQDRAPKADVERSAATFQRSTYPTLRQYFGAEPNPGVSGDGRVTFLLGNVPGVAAYFSGADTYPRALSSRSNGREIIYVNLPALRPGGASFDSTIAHEFQHLLHFAHCPTQETWVDEGSAELASRVAGFTGSGTQDFLSRPNVQLTTWANNNDLARHYESAYLFLRYVADRFGGWSALPDLYSTCARGEDLFRQFLARRGLAPDMESLFADWTVANLLDDRTLADGRYGYDGGALGPGRQVHPTASASRSVPFSSELPQYSADYVELPTGSGTIAFSGNADVPLLGAPIESPGGVWWSNRGDSLDSRLTRTLDLRGLSHATARFRVWYDTEDQYDYVYLSASQDGGHTWHTLSGTYTRADSAIGNDLGAGWTGVSGGGATPAWLQEEVDLSAYAGSEILLRFEYLTDQGYNAQGFALDTFQVPEMGDNVTDDGWQADGWLRVDAPVPQQWNLRLVRWTPAGAQVDPVPVGADGKASLALDPAASRAVLVVAPTAPRTIQPASYTLTVSGT